MKRIEGTAARQLDLLGDFTQHDSPRITPTPAPARRRPAAMRLLQKDVYAELARRRRRAQITARHLLDQDI